MDRLSPRRILREAKQSEDEGVHESVEHRGPSGVLESSDQETRNYSCASATISSGSGTRPLTFRSPLTTRAGMLMTP